MARENPTTGKQDFDYRLDVQKNFAERYLNTYFHGSCEFPRDEQAICRFLVQECRKIVGTPVMLDIGCGPGIQHELPAAPYVSSVIMADYLSDNLEAIKKWKDRDAKSHNWNHFTRFILRCENECQEPSKEDIDRREEELRAKIKELKPTNVLEENILGQTEQFGVIGFFYCAETAARNHEEWQNIMRRVSVLVEPGGLMLMSCCRNAQFYHVNIPGESPEKIPVLQIEESHFEKLLPQLGFDMGQSIIEVAKVNMGHIGIDEIILLSLKKPPSRQQAQNIVRGEVAQTLNPAQ